MKIGGLETWLGNWTNYYRVISDSWRDEDETQLTFNFNSKLDYLWKNITKNYYFQMPKRYFEKGGKKTIHGYDKEGIIIQSEERLIHPVLLSQHLKQEIITMEKELTSLTMQRLKDSELNLGLIHI